jgi:membrane-associated phospholipid phosphatase
MSYDGMLQYRRAPLAVRVAVALVITLAFLVNPALLDQWGYHHAFVKNVYDHDWARFLRVMGFWPTWLVIAFAVFLQHREIDAAAAKKYFWLIAGSPAVAGLLCEIMKLLIRRERPETADGEWVFRAWSDHPWSSAGLSTPSSHVMVAFGGAVMLARIFPKARWVYYVLAWGCAMTRVFAHAHYVSDVTFGALLAWAVAWGLWIEVGRRAMHAEPAS